MHSKGLQDSSFTPILSQPTGCRTQGIILIPNPKLFTECRIQGNGCRTPSPDRSWMQDPGNEMQGPGGGVQDPLPSWSRKCRTEALPTPNHPEVYRARGCGMQPKSPTNRGCGTRGKTLMPNRSLGCRIRSGRMWGDAGGCALPCPNRAWGCRTHAKGTPEPGRDAAGLGVRDSGGDVGCGWLGKYPLPRAEGLQEHSHRG